MQQPQKSFLSIMVDWLRKTLESNDEAVSSFVKLRELQNSKEKGEEMYKEWVSQMLKDYDTTDLGEVKPPGSLAAKKAVRKVAMELSSTLPLIAATYIHLENIPHTDIVAWMNDETEQDSAEKSNAKERRTKGKAAVHERDHNVVAPEIAIHAQPDSNSDVVGKLVSGQSFFSSNPHTTVGDQTWAEIRTGYVLLSEGNNRFATLGGPRTQHFYDYEKGTPEFTSKIEDVVNWIQNYVSIIPDGSVSFGRLGAVLSNGVYSKIVKASGGCRSILANYTDRITNTGATAELVSSDIPPAIPIADNAEDGRTLRSEEKKPAPKEPRTPQQERPDMGPILIDEPSSTSFHPHDRIMGAIPQPPTQPPAQSSLSDLLDIDINDVTNRPVQPPPSMNPQPVNGNGGRRVKTCNNWNGVVGSCRFGDSCAFPHPNGGQPPQPQQPPPHQPPSHQPPQPNMNPIQVTHRQPIVIHPIPQQPVQRPIGMQPIQLPPPQNPQQGLPPISPEEMHARQMLDSLLGAQRERKRQMAAASMGTNIVVGGPMKRHAPMARAPILP
eukprot:TRINITY_DN16639_c0_g1_i1.p1 TRINITY_DN16639_c0_g1~~TRINITY_DN16639_c0_g1_i1.p1  ORF type:complete len:552 (+),score=121.06 TRINITY_DN16639_c0_g1_i1:63-1718(+)